MKHSYCLHCKLLLLVTEKLSILQVLLYYPVKYTKPGKLQFKQNQGNIMLHRTKYTSGNTEPGKIKVTKNKVNNRENIW